MIVEKTPMISQLQTTHIGPPRSNTIQYEVRQPARIEMIVNEMAKFWNPPIARKSSCA
jgi:hypothetical protein